MCCRCQGAADLVSPTSMSKKKTSEVRRTPIHVKDNKVRSALDNIVV